jgi:hypothetical protein
VSREFSEELDRSLVFETSQTGAIVVGDEGVEVGPHRLDDVVERQFEAAAQLENQGFFPGGDRGDQAMRAGRAVGDVAAGFPARDGAGMMPSSRASAAREAVLCSVYVHPAARHKSTLLSSFFLTIGRHQLLAQPADGLPQPPHRANLPGRNTFAGMSK